MQSALRTVLLLLLVTPWLAPEPSAVPMGSPSAGRPPPMAFAATSERQSPRATGTLQGTVRWNRADVLPPAVEYAVDPVGCIRRPTSENRRVAEGGGFNNVIVALVDAPIRTAVPLVPGRLRLDNTDCHFSPQVAVLTVGSVLEIRNTDPMLHLVHLYGQREANLAFPPQDTTVSRTLEAAGMLVVKCDLHPWMQAFIRVDDHPFHAVTDGDGSFRMTDVPAGEYTLEAWHETLGTQRLTVQVGNDDTTTIALEFLGR
jgi:plastocyanin